MAIKFEGNEIMSVDDFGILECYRDLWKTASEKKNAIRQGIISTDGCTINCMRLRINAADKSATPAEDKLLLQMHMGTNSSFLSTLKCQTVRHPITKGDLERDYVMKLHSTITTE